MRLCGAKTRQGAPCKGRAMPNGRCRMHGGSTPVGINLPQFKAGRYSKYIPDRLSTKYNESLSDPKLLEMREEVALIDGRLSELLTNLQKGDTKTLWTKLQKAWGSYKSASDDKAVFYLMEIGELIKNGNEAYALWDEVYQVVEQRRRVVESERKRLVEMQQTITNDRAMILIGALLGIIKEHVRDTTTLRAISNDIRAITMVESS